MAAQNSGIAALAVDLQTAAPIADEICAFEFVENRAFGIAAHQREDHTEAVAGKLVEVVVGGAAGDRAAEAEGVALAAQICALHAFGRDDVVDAGGRDKAHQSAAGDDAGEQFGVFTGHRVAADDAEVLAKTAEEIEGAAAEADVGAEVIVNRVELGRRSGRELALVVDSQADVEARAEPSRRFLCPSG